jgi:hypothetical protein
MVRRVIRRQKTRATEYDGVSTIDYHDVKKPKVKLPAHPVVSANYHRPPRELSTYVDDYADTLS